MAIKDCNGLEIPHSKAAISFRYFPCRYMVRRDADLCALLCVCSNDACRGFRTAALR
jgi:hypothetical protein